MGKKKVLIIDDDTDIVEAMKVILKGKAYEVASAFSGAEGIKKAKSEKPDLIILDVMMETIDKGFDVARKLKQEAQFKKVPILMLTAIAERTGFSFSAEAGDETWLPVDDYIEKPLKPQELLSKVKSFIG
jgi:CheY-like chemotaxis protein